MPKKYEFNFLINKKRLRHNKRPRILFFKILLANFYNPPAPNTHRII